MKFNLPTRERCQEIIKECEEFYCIETEVSGYKAEIYNYRLASYMDFVKHDAFELRGLTFIQHEDGLWYRHIALNKFFNIGQCGGENFFKITFDNDEIHTLSENHLVQLKDGSLKLLQDVTVDDEIESF